MPGTILVTYFNLNLNPMKKQLYAFNLLTFGTFTENLQSFNKFFDFLCDRFCLNLVCLKICLYLFLSSDNNLLWTFEYEVLLWRNFLSLLTLSWRRPLSYRNQSIDFLCKLMDWFLCDNGLRHERVNQNFDGCWKRNVPPSDCQIFNLTNCWQITGICQKQVWITRNISNYFS